jgi:hypothetical protein
VDENDYGTIDRLSSDDYYTEDNTVPCCIKCNIMKGSMDVYTFINKVEHIAGKLGNFKDEDKCNEYPELFPNPSKKCNYKAYLKSAQKRNIDFNIDEKIFNLIISKNCYICEKKSNGWNIGIDRYDSKKSYTEENIRPCCGHCNLMKNKFTFIEFYLQVINIYKNKRSIIKYLDKANFIVLEPTIVKIKKSKFNKMTREEKAERTRKFKEERDKKMLDKYDVEKILKQRDTIKRKMFKQRYGFDLEENDELYFDDNNDFYDSESDEKEKHDKKQVENNINIVNNYYDSNNNNNNKNSNNNNSNNNNKKYKSRNRNKKKSKVLNKPCGYCKICLYANEEYISGREPADCKRCYETGYYYKMLRFEKSLY